MRRVLRVLVPSACAALLAFAPAASRAGDDAKDPRQRAAAIEKDVLALFAQKKYADAAEKCREEIALVPTSPNPQYNLACALARLGKSDDAIAALRKSVELGFDDA